MKAVRMTGIHQPVKMMEISVPETGPKDVLVKIKAAGICHSDVHYLEGVSPQAFLPITLGHEVSGVIEKIGSEVKNRKIGERVCIHYNISCGECQYCLSGNDQFCPEAKMIGHHLDGGYAEYIAVPARNAIHLPDEISFEEGATLMCASATSFHALLKARIKAGDKVAIFGAGGLGQSAVQLAATLGATKVFAVDLNDEKLKLAQKNGAIPINAKELNPVEEIKKLNNGKGVDISLELIGLPQTQKQAINSVGPLGRVVFVGLASKSIEVDTYREVLANEAELIGSNDHLLTELPLLIDFAKNKQLDTSSVVSKTIPLDEELINQALKKLSEYSGKSVRTVIVP